ncbi:MAG: alpha/beta hydrolase [Alphaproteobacteria bacterium]|nr:alpha/beta hydrolase [Alphaproteobacteria bacterium]
MLRWIALAVFLSIALAAAWVAWALNERSGPVTREALCYVGAYALEGGGDAVIVAYDDGDEMEFFFPDGARGVMTKRGTGLFEGDGVRFARPDCAVPRATFAKDGKTTAAAKRRFEERTLRVVSGGIELAAKLVLPPDPPRQAVIWVAGSNDDGDIDRIHWQYTLPLQGVASLILDKRGTGGSQGSATADFHVRAADVRASVGELRRLLGPNVEIGLHGASQGGWVAPLAALDGGVSFVVVSYGLAEGVTAEDRDEMAAYIKKAGYGERELAQLRTLTGITAKIVCSNWRDGWNELAAWRAAHADEAWPESLPSTSYTGVLLKIPSFAAGWVGPIIGRALDKDVSFAYDPRPTLAHLKARQLWLLGGADTSAPAAATVVVLRELQAAGAPIEVVVYPDASHGLMEPWPGRNAERLAPGYRETVAEWVKTRALAGAAP